MLKFLWMALMLVIAVVIYFYIIPTTLIFLWDNSVFINNESVSHMPYLVAVGIELFTTFLCGRSMLNFKFDYSE